MCDCKDLHERVTDLEREVKALMRGLAAAYEAAEVDMPAELRPKLTVVKRT